MNDFPPNGSAARPGGDGRPGRHPWPPPGSPGDNRRVSSGDSHQVTESVQGLPAPALRPYVAWYSGYRLAGHGARPAPRPAVAVYHDDHHAGRRAGAGRAHRPAATARPVHHAARRPAHHAGDHRPPGPAVRHPARDQAARRAAAVRPARRRARRGRCRRGRHPRPRGLRAARAGPRGSRLATAVRRDRCDAAAAAAGQPGRQPGSQPGLADAAGQPGHRGRQRAGRRGGLERPAPRHQVPGRDRPGPEGGRPGGALRPGPPAAAAPGRGRGQAGTRRARRRVRLLRPGASGPRVPRPGRCPPSRWIAEEFRNVQAAAT